MAKKLKNKIESELKSAIKNAKSASEGNYPSRPIEFLLIEIPENQKNIVRKRVEYYNSNPDELISEKDTWEMIDS